MYNSIIYIIEHFFPIFWVIYYPIDFDVLLIAVKQISGSCKTVLRSCQTVIKQLQTVVRQSSCSHKQSSGIHQAVLGSQQAVTDSLRAFIRQATSSYRQSAGSHLVVISLLELSFIAQPLRLKVFSVFFLNHQCCLLGNRYCHLQFWCGFFCKMHLKLNNWLFPPSLITTYN